MRRAPGRAPAHQAVRDPPTHVPPLSPPFPPYPLSFSSQRGFGRGLGWPLPVRRRSAAGARASGHHLAGGAHGDAHHQLGTSARRRWVSPGGLPYLGPSVATQSSGVAAARMRAAQATFQDDRHGPAGRKGGKSVLPTGAQDPPPTAVAPPSPPRPNCPHPLPPAPPASAASVTSRDSEAIPSATSLPPPPSPHLRPPAGPHSPFWPTVARP